MYCHAACQVPVRRLCRGTHATGDTGGREKFRHAAHLCCTEAPSGMRSNEADREPSTANVSGHGRSSSFTSVAALHRGQARSNVGSGTAACQLVCTGRGHTPRQKGSPGKRGSPLQSVQASATSTVEASVQQATIESLIRQCCLRAEEKLQAGKLAGRRPGRQALHASCPSASLMHHWITERGWEVARAGDTALTLCRRYRWRW